MNKKQSIIVLVSVLVLLFVGIISYFLISSNKKYEVIFETNGGSVIEKQIVKKNDKILKPEDPIKEGYIFEGWYFENELYSFDNKITSDIVLEAKYIENDNSMVTVIYMVDNNIIDTIKTQKNTKLTKIEDPIKEGYTFEGWYLNEEIFTFDKEVTEDITLKAVFNKVDEITVTFNSNGGSKVSSKSVKLGEKVIKPSNPTRNGYTFNGWYLDGKYYNFNTEVTKDITLVAKWTKNNSTNNTTTSTTSTTTTKQPTTSTTTTKPITTSTTTTTTTQKVKTYSYQWGSEKDAAGQSYLYIVDENGTKVSGTVTVTYNAASYSETVSIPVSGKLLIRDLVSISNIKVN